MTSEQLRAELAGLGISQVGFAGLTRTNARTVRRWTSGEQDVPPWVPVMVHLLHHVDRAKWP